MNISFDKFQQSGKYSAQIAIYQTQLIREGNVTDQKYLSITYLQTDYLNLDSISGSGRKNEVANIVQKVLTILQKMFKKYKKGQGKISCRW